MSTGFFFSTVTVEKLEKGITDHCLLLMETSSEVVCRYTPFNFLNILTDIYGFDEFVQRVWSQNCKANPLLNIWYKLKHLKVPFKEVNIVHFKGITKKLYHIRDDLKVVQQQLSQDHSNLLLTTNEKMLLGDVEYWAIQKNKLGKKNPRLIGIYKTGDVNTKFFHAYAKDRQIQNTIKFFVGRNRVRLQSHVQFVQEVRSFYQLWMGSDAPPLPMVDRVVIARGPVLDHYHQSILCEQIISEEIKVLCSAWTLSKYTTMIVFLAHRCNFLIPVFFTK